MPSNNIIHQSGRAPSSNTTSRTVSAEPRREYGASKHTSHVNNNGKTTVVNHKKTGYDSCPSPRYDGVYKR
ncbi:hypothetical protein PT974_06352 [Cladobotryum mycophilum]|uniref:Uncharacterized protein n=1 Tax=Cladobotryum mycophilum TaxID=491253 RepID=A0ABR0SM05_9HYPO